ncbi:MAG: TQO small subunit DoxD, partial [Candidatus Dormibacterales bacterium]
MPRRRRPGAEEGRADPLLKYGTLPLRLFLGATFVYAGVQKLSDPGFLAPGSPTYIGTQLEAYSAHSPLGPLLRSVAIPLGPLTGAAVIAAELVIGALVLAGLYTRRAALAGAALNFLLFLTATWQVQPYFLGSDTVYAVAWITLALVGDQGVFSVQPRWDAWYHADGPEDEPDEGRRRFLLGLGGVAVALVWVLALLPRTPTRAHL